MVETTERSGTFAHYGKQPGIALAIYGTAGIERIIENDENPTVEHQRAAIAESWSTILQLFDQGGTINSLGEVSIGNTTAEKIPYIKSYTLEPNSTKKISYWKREDKLSPTWIYVEGFADKEKRSLLRCLAQHVKGVYKDHDIDLKNRISPDAVVREIMVEMADSFGKRTQSLICP